MKAILRLHTCTTPWLPNCSVIKMSYSLLWSLYIINSIVITIANIKLQTLNYKKVKATLIFFVTYVYTMIHSCQEIPSYIRKSWTLSFSFEDKVNILSYLSLCNPYCCAFPSSF